MTMSNRTNTAATKVAGPGHIIEVEASLVRDTDDAFLLTVDDETETWVPKSQVTDNENGTFSMPYWLALDHGLI
jgi:hypothetical protein